MNNILLFTLFPNPYSELIKKLAIEAGLDPLIVTSLIKQESAFNADAVSSAGARGLMQLMPLTAKSIKKKVRREQLAIPEHNLRIGITYLKKLLIRYNGNLIYSLMAYNAGEKNADRWIKHIFPKLSDQLQIVEAIPFSETQGYVQTIVRNIFFYKLLYDIPLKKHIKDSKSYSEIFGLKLNDVFDKHALSGASFMDGDLSKNFENCTNGSKIREVAESNGSAGSLPLSLPKKAL
ncbi:MAG: lytic transglycosylase domain-containing protein [Oligoflexia bacterium]|nr:lytic transglycosylase domain-containing protein [Oligoflexia bacterium]